MEKRFEIMGVFVGILEDGVYKTRRKTAHHFYIKGKGYPISVKILEELKELNCELIKIIEEKDGVVIAIYETEFFNYYYGNEFQEKGYDKQRVFPLREMRKIWVRD